jgi:hypothetical protein
MRSSATRKRCWSPASTERAQRLKAPADLPELRDREILVNVLTAFGTMLLTETTDPVVVALFRPAGRRTPS